MVSSDKKLANVVGGKTARACDSCIKKRARWYCAADDAFLCQLCDGLVHSANPLARRHERVRLKIAFLKLENQNPSPPWHQGFTKKPRTPRGRQTQKSDEKMMRFNPLHLVPEMDNDEPAIQTSDEQLLYRVPEMCFSGNSNSPAATTPGSKSSFDLNSLNGLLLPSDMELAEFAADVESLLGKGLDDESFDMEGLGFLDCGEKVKIEEEMMKSEVIMESEIDMMREPFQLSFDYDSPEEDLKVAVEGGGCGGEECPAVVVKEDYVNGGDSGKNKRILKLDYDGIIAAWDDQRSPWTTGDRPELDPNDCWPDCMGGFGIMHHHPCGHMGMMTGNPAMLDGGREARVSRYREKRRTRLFSKKIRYEVRKLNAEKRPRMKGRFVKRTNFATNVSGFPLLSK